MTTIPRNEKSTGAHASIKKILQSKHMSLRTRSIHEDSFGIGADLRVYDDHVPVLAGLNHCGVYNNEVLREKTHPERRSGSRYCEDKAEVG
jgi:hypothetical protein